MEEIVYLEGEGALVTGGDLDDPTLGLLFRWGMPQDTERIRARYSIADNYRSVFEDLGKWAKDYYVEYFGVAITAREFQEKTHEMLMEKFGGKLIQFHTDDGIKALSIWLYRVWCARTLVFVETLWDQEFGWQTITDFDAINLRDRAELKSLIRVAMISSRLQNTTFNTDFPEFPRVGRPRNSGWFKSPADFQTALEEVLRACQKRPTQLQVLKKLDAHKFCQLPPKKSRTQSDTKHLRNWIQYARLGSFDEALKKYLPVQE